MRQIPLLLLCITICCTKGFSQDTITTTSGTIMLVEVIKADDKKVYYKLFGEPDAADESLNMNVVASIGYRDGKPPIPADPGMINNGSYDESDVVSMRLKGYSDARMNYRAPGGAWAGTFITTMLTGGIVGLIPAIACSSTPPAEHRLNYPSDHLMNNPAYAEAYRTKAKKIKQGKVWGAYGYGLLGAVLSYLLISAANR